MSEKPFSTTDYVQKVAQKRGWSLNPDPAFVAHIVAGLDHNRQKSGCYFCPCRDSDHDKQKDRDLICPCHYAEADIQEFGHCYCALFFDPEKTGQEAESIPDRRP